MSLISEQVKLLRELQDNPEIDMVPIYEMNKACKEAADTIEDLSAKLATANMERSTAYYNGGWIPVEEGLPDKPEENPEFENKPLDLYLVSERGSKYPFRAFWNGENFTDGLRRVDATAWMPLPQPYKPKGE